MKFLSTLRYYNKNFEHRFNYKPHEGAIPAALKQDIQEGKKWPLEKLYALVSWMMREKRRDRLFYDATLMCEQIAEKIGKCSKITNRKNEFRRAQKRFERIRKLALSFYDAAEYTAPLEAKLALGARIRASYMLHDYDDIANIQERRGINPQHYAYTHNQLRRLENISMHPPVMRLKGKRRMEYEAREKTANLEYMSSYMSAAIQPITSLSEINACFLAEQKDRNERSLAEIILDSTA